MSVTRALPSEFVELSPGDQLDYINDLWRHLLEQPEVPVPEWHLDVLRERLAQHQAAPAGEAWEAVRAKISAAIAKTR